jgi:hypothetical protein
MYAICQPYDCNSLIVNIGFNKARTLFSNGAFVKGPLCFYRHDFSLLNVFFIEDVLSLDPY